MQKRIQKEGFSKGLYLGAFAGIEAFILVRIVDYAPQFISTHIHNYLDVDIVTVHQNVGAARAYISHGENDLAGDLMLHIHVELLDPAQLEVQVLRLDGSRKGRGRRWRRDNLEAI